MKKNLAILILLLTIGILIIYNLNIVSNIAGRFIYPLDDAYIHLSMARNFSEFGQWGITQYQFSSTTSSPLYTYVLALTMNFFGNWEYIPLILNSIAGLFIIWIFHKYLQQCSIITYCIILFSIVLLMPLHLMIMTGMEHVFHSLAMVTVLLQFQKFNNVNSAKNFANLALASILAVGFRYESLFFILIICFYLFFINKDYFKSIGLGLFAISPVIIYGIISLNHGSFFLPNSLILKGNTNDGIIGFISRVAGNGYRGISVLFMVLILLIQIFFKTSHIKTFKGRISKNAIQLVVLFGFGFHLLFANFGWLIRYEAYLIVIILFAITPFIDELLKYKMGHIVLKTSVAFLMLVTCYVRFVPMLKYQPIASKNIFDQQIQLANFIHDNYKNSKVIANDIGAITYFNNIHLLDTYGLGSIEVAKLRKEDHAKFTDNKKLQDYISKTAQEQKFEIAIVFDEWVKMPDYFTKVGTLTIVNNYICGGNTVSFYSVQGENSDKLRNNLREFSKKAPKDVSVNIIN